MQKSFSDLRLFSINNFYIIQKQLTVYKFRFFFLIDIDHFHFSASKIFCSNLDSVGDLKSNIV